MRETLLTLFFIFVAAFVAPIIADAIPRVRVPVVVIEIALGILLGPQVLGVAQVDETINLFAELGLAFLFFLAGFEIDIDEIWGKPLNLGAAGWGISLVMAFAIGGVLQLTAGSSFLYVGLAMATTAIGTLLPMLRDSGELNSGFGKFVSAAGAVGEFGPIVMMALLLSQTRRFAGNVLVLAGFVLIVMVAVFLARRWRPQRIVSLVKRTMHSSAQVAMRLSVAVLVVFIALSVFEGLDFLLGAFAAGAIALQVVKTVDSHSEIETLRIKYEGVGFGFIIPIFFIVSGIKFDLYALLSSPLTLLMVPVFALLFLIVRGLPAFLVYRGTLQRGEIAPLALFSATQLPLVIAITDLGVENGMIDQGIATAMVGAGMLSVFIFPLVAFSMRRGESGPAEPISVPAE